jgi:predicted 3-demethylubiquinone-9 3-methyltransferase (glyoxalase superfamily)
VITRNTAPLGISVARVVTGGEAITIAAMAEGSSTAGRRYKKRAWVVVAGREGRAREELQPERRSSMASGARTQLMFTGEAAAALELYGAVFPTFRVERPERYGPGEKRREGSIRIAQSSLEGHRLAVIDSPAQHAFGFTRCESADELDTAFGALSAGGQVLMPVGVSWQLTLP